MKDFKTIQRELAQPFSPEDLDWRVQVTNKEKTKGMAVPFVTSRAIQDRLDNVVGAENWRNEFQVWQESGNVRAQLCGLSIYLEERKEWVTKWDGAENTDIESVKGRRAVGHWPHSVLARACLGECRASRQRKKRGYSKGRVRETAQGLYGRAPKYGADPGATRRDAVPADTERERQRRRARSAKPDETRVSVRTRKGRATVPKYNARRVQGRLPCGIG